MFSLNIGRREIYIRENYLLIVLFSITLCFILPNLFIFSTDDLYIYVNSGINGKFSLSQEGEGRYTFALICYLINIFGLSNTSYIIISTAIFSIALPILYIDLIKLVSIHKIKSIICGYLTFISFGLLLDLYQFVFAQLSYAVSLLCAHVLMRSAASTYLNLRRKFIIASIFSFLGIGSYQLFLTIIPISVLTILYVENISNHTIYRKEKDFILIIIVGCIIGSFLYFFANDIFKMLNFSNFSHYPRRDQGVHFISANIKNYFDTILDLISIRDSSRYSIFLPSVCKITIYSIIIFNIINFNEYTGSKQFFVSIIILIGIFMIWANPINSMLASYWPSARSLSAFGIFIGIAAALSIEKNSAILNISYLGRAKIFTVYLLILFQIITFSIRMRDRFVQQSEDISFSQAIMTNIYNINPFNEIIYLKVGMKISDHQKFDESSYDFGRSLFQTSWSSPALFEYISRGRVSATFDEDNKCASTGNLITIDKENSNHVLVCVPL